MKCESRRNSPPLGNAHQLVILFQMTSPEYMHAVNIIWTEMFAFMYLETCRYIHNQGKKRPKI